jgi:hypothetical protein
MKDRGTLSSVEALIEVYMIANEPQTLRDEYSWATKILDAEYKQVSVSLDDVIKTCENLHVEEQHQLKILLQKYEHLFEGTLGEFNMEPISLQLMDPNCKPIYARAYNVPRSVEQQLHPSKEIVRLVAIPKKNGTSTTRVVTDFRKLNLLLKLKLSPISYSKDCSILHDPFNGRVYLCSSIRLKYGLLSHKTWCWCSKAMYHCIPMGEIQIQTLTHGYQDFHRCFSKRHV